MSQITNTVLIVRPVNTNNEESIQTKVLAEFDNLILELEKCDVNVIVHKSECNAIDDSISVDWLSFHEEGTVAVYPLSSDKKRVLRNEAILGSIEKLGYKIDSVVDYTEAEQEGYFMEGNESIVLDRVNKIGYAAVSSKTDEELFIEFCEDFEYTPIVFSAKGKNGRILDHTSDMMTIGDSFVIVASSLIQNKKEKKLVLSKLKESGREIIYITEEQVGEFASGIVQVRNKDGDPLLLMSKKTYNVFSGSQMQILKGVGGFLICDVSTIETVLGKSLHSVVNYVFLPLRD